MKLTKQQAEQIFLNNYTFVRKVALQTAPIRNVQEDIAHDVFVDFMRKFDEWDYDPATIKPLLRKMTQITSLQYWRRHLDGLPERLRDATEILWRQPTTWDEQEQTTWDEQMAALDVCLGKLSAENRDLVDDYYFAEVAWRELAEKRNEKLGTLRMKMCRIRALLFDCVNKVLGVDIK